MTLSNEAKAALSLAFASRGKHKGQLLANCPKSGTPAAAAWQGVIAVCNPYRLGIGHLMFMSDADRAIYSEVEAFIASLPRATMIALQRDRSTLESLGAW